MENFKNIILAEVKLEDKNYCIMQCVMKLKETKSKQ